MGEGENRREGGCQGGWAGGGSGMWQAEALEEKWPRKEEASEDQKAREPCLSHRGGDIWLKPKEEIKGCVEETGPTES